jgi:peptidoglycan/xylan/chitin deacetylase (PgdA/CDA1 family)
LKQLPNDVRVEILSKNGYTLDKEFEEPQALQKEQIVEMSSFVNFQSHTLSHPILPKCKYEVAKSEIFLSKKILESDYDLNINTISYPNGDYSNRDIELSRNAGYKCGITVDYGFNTINTDLFKLKRISANDTEDLNELIVKTSGVWAFIKTLNGRKQKFGLSNVPKN